MSKAKPRDWIVMGGKPGELAHCQRCGKGAEAVFPLEIPMAVAMCKAFVKMHARCEPKWVEPTPQSPAAWMGGRDAGISSKTICAAFTGYLQDHYDVPHDPADFGRCYRFLKLFPDARQFLRRTVDLCPKWEPFVAAWDELTAMYEVELPTGEAPKLWARMRQLEGAKP